MKVELDLPDWVDDDSAIRIFKGIELVAKKMMNEPWKIKTVRCNFCGDCCIKGNPGWDLTDVSSGIDGFCNRRIPKPGHSDKFMCSLGSGRPFSCSAYANGPNDMEICCIRWKTLD